MTTINTEARSHRDRINDALERLARVVTSWVGGNWAFALAVFLVAAWALAGPFVGYTETWQLVIHTATTIITFLMVFLLQRSQNKDSRAIQLKLNELLAAIEGASPQLIDAEELSESQLSALKERYEKLIEVSSSRRESRSVEETGRGDGDRR